MRLTGEGEAGFRLPLKSSRYALASVDVDFEVSKQRLFIRTYSMEKLYKPLFVIALMAGASTVFACGESMFHADQGMRYHGFTTHRPADILVYQPDAKSDDADQQVYAALQRAGHHLTVVDQQPAAIDALNSRHFDVIIAPPGDMDALAAHLNSSSRAPTLLPVIPAGDASAQARFPQYVRQNDSADKYLKSIEQSMRARS
jgi:hypothetical protein